LLLAENLRRQLSVRAEALTGNLWAPDPDCYLTEARLPADRYEEQPSQDVSFTAYVKGILKTANIERMLSSIVSWRWLVLPGCMTQADNFEEAGKIS